MLIILLMIIPSCIQSDVNEASSLILIDQVSFVGNHKIVELLRQGELPQSSLFTGPEGVGKKTLVLSLAALANCKQPIQNDLCGNCSSCMKAVQDNHPDILLFQPEKELIRTKVTRRLSREAQFRPFEGRLRFFIIDEDILPGFASAIRVIPLLSPIENISSTLSNLADLFSHFK